MFKTNLLPLTQDFRFKIKYLHLLDYQSDLDEKKTKQNQREFVLLDVYRKFSISFLKQPVFKLIKFFTRDLRVNLPSIVCGFLRIFLFELKT